MGLATSTEAKKYAADFSLHPACKVKNDNGTCITEVLIAGERRCTKDRNCGFDLKDKDTCPEATKSDYYNNISCDTGHTPVLAVGDKSCTYECKKI